MQKMDKQAVRPGMMCDICPGRRMAERSPESFLGRMWAWHTGWCPGWKRYVKARHAHGEGPPSTGSRRGMWAEDAE